MLTLTVCLLAACGEDTFELSVDLRTDLVPMVEFETVQVSLPDEGIERRVDVSTGGDFFLTTRVADFDGLTATSQRPLRVALLDRSGRVVIARDAVVNQQRDVAVTLTISRDCRGVECGERGGQSCLGGRCVESDCVTGLEPSCPDVECRDDVECASLSSCSRPRCAETQCLYEPIVGACGAGEYCAAEMGCAPIPPPGEWQLPEGYFVPARMPMTLVHPREDDTPAFAYSKNAHPGVRWEIPIVVQGGAWPFRYEILNDGGATGLQIGGELARSEEGDVISHRVTDDYGVLSWDDPQLGTYGLELRVTDQEGAILEVPISLTVGTEGWVFVDAERGDDANDGSQGSPFATIEALYGADRSPYAEHRVYLAGLVPMDGNRDNGNLRVAAAPSRDADLAPRIWVGLPGGDAVLEAYEGNFVLDAPDFYLANLEHRHRADFFQDEGSVIHMILAFDNTARFVMHDVTISRFQGVAVNSGIADSSVVLLSRSVAPRRHAAIVGCTLTGPSGIFVSALSLDHAVFEKNRVVSADLEVADGSVPALLVVKDGSEWVSVRANEMWDGNTWGRFAGIGLIGARNVELAHNVIDTPFDSGRDGALRLWTNAASTFEWTADTPVWLDRNSLRRRIVWEGSRLENMADGTVRIARNVVEPTPVAEDRRITNTENLEGEALLGEDMRLTGDARSTHLGLRGAELAAPR